MLERQTLKTLFADDSDMMRLIEARERDEQAKKEPKSTVELLNVLENRNQTDLLREIAANKGLMKGEKGDTPEKGKDYFTPDEVDAVMRFVKEGVKDEVRPIKGIDYFDGERGADGTDGDHGYSPVKGIDYFDGERGADGISVSEDDIRMIMKEMTDELDLGMSREQVEALIKKHSKNLHDNFGSRLENLRAYVELNYGGHGGTGGGGGGTGSPTRQYSLSSQLNGSTKSFTIPANAEIVGIFGSSAPFVFDPATDYTGSGTTTLSFTASVDAQSALAGGQTLIVQYGTGSPTRQYSLSSQLNGSTKSFTIPANAEIVGIFGSSAPFVFDPATDYTGSGTTTLSFTASVDAQSALAGGQTLIVQYS